MPDGQPIAVGHLSFYLNSFNSCNSCSFLPLGLRRFPFGGNAQTYALHSHQRVRVGIHYHHSLLARCLEALLRLVATHDPVVLVDEHRASRATFAEAALYQLLPLLGASVEMWSS